jgi:CRP-like cAMP-binding protein
LPAHKVSKIVKADGPISIVRDPTDLPAPIGARGPKRVRVDLETIEVTGNLADGATYRYWTFNQKVPGPFIRVRVGDTVEVRLKNHDDSVMMHNVDFHAVTGPGGGAKATDAAPGESRGFEFTAINPGLYVYHCAVPMAAQHIANGMYGLILVEPEGGLPKVDREFYVMQGEIYPEQKLGSKGEFTESVTQVTPHGEQIVVRFVSPGDLFGVAMALGRDDYPGTATAIVDSLALLWPSAAWPEMIARHPALATNAMRVIGGRLQDAHKRLREISTEDVERRVAHAVLKLADDAGKKSPAGTTIDFPVSRQDIAEMTATTLHTVSRIMSAWEAAGVIEGGRQRIAIRDWARLQIIADGQEA